MATDPHGVTDEEVAQRELEDVKVVRTDKDRLDFLQMLTNKGEYTGKVIMRNSTTGRGWRMNETSWPGAVDDVREAIDNYMDGVEGQEPSMADVVLKFNAEQFKNGDGEE